MAFPCLLAPIFCQDAMMMMMMFQPKKGNTLEVKYIQLSEDTICTEFLWSQLLIPFLISIFLFIPAGHKHSAREPKTRRSYDRRSELVYCHSNSGNARAPNIRWSEEGQKQESEGRLHLGWNLCNFHSNLRSAQAGATKTRLSEACRKHVRFCIFISKRLRVSRAKNTVELIF